jgi:hypothetical protein
VPLPALCTLSADAGGHAVCGLPVAGNPISKSAKECWSLVSVLRCEVEFSAKGLSFAQRNSNECGVSECDIETSKGGVLGPPGLYNQAK